MPSHESTNEKIPPPGFSRVVLVKTTFFRSGRTFKMPKIYIQIRQKFQIPIQLGLPKWQTSNRTAKGNPIKHVFNQSIKDSIA
jgi:hypothetical protein